MLGGMLVSGVRETRFRLLSTPRGEAPCCRFSELLQRHVLRGPGGYEVKLALGSRKLKLERGDRGHQMPAFSELSVKLARCPPPHPP